MGKFIKKRQNKVILLFITRAREEYILTPEKLTNRYKLIGPEKENWQRYKAIGEVSFLPIDEMFSY